MYPSSIIYLTLGNLVMMVHAYKLAYHNMIPPPNNIAGWNVELGEITESLSTVHGGSSINETGKLRSS